MLGPAAGHLEEVRIVVYTICVEFVCFGINALRKESKSNFVTDDILVQPEDAIIVSTVDEDVLNEVDRPEKQ